MKKKLYLLLNAPRKRKKIKELIAEMFLSRGNAFVTKK